MALIVEDGSGVSAADSYISTADADTYWAKFGSPSEWSNASTAQKESALRHATRWIDEQYARRWAGVVTHSSQELRWPRSGVTDDEGRIIDDTEIPRVLSEAVCQFAFLHLAGGGLSRVVSSGVQSESLEGVVSRTYFAPSGELKANEFGEYLLGSLLTTPHGVYWMQRG